MGDDAGGRAPGAGSEQDVDTVDLSWITVPLRRIGRLLGSDRRAVSVAPREAVDSPPSLEISDDAGQVPALGRRELLLAVVVGVAVALWMTRRAWGGRPLPGADSMAHLIRADFAVYHLLPRGRLDGWQPSFILGYQAYLFLGPGLSWAVAALHWLTVGLLSTTGALKVLSVGAFVGRPLVVAFTARSFGLDRRASGFAGVLSLCVNSPFGVGLSGIFEIGLLSHELGAIFFFLALGGAIRLVRTPRRGWTVFTAVSLGALFVTHDVSALVLVVLLAVLLCLFAVQVKPFPSPRDDLRAIVRSEVRSQLSDLRLVEQEADGAAPPGPTPAARSLDRRVLGHLCLAGALAAGLSAFLILPLLAHRDLEGVFTGWGTPPLGTRLLQIWRGQLLFRPPVPYLVVAGSAWALVRGLRGERYGLPLALGPLLYLVVAHIAMSWWPTNIGLQQLDVRGLGYVGVVAVLPLGGLLSLASRALDSVDLPGNIVALVAVAAIVILPSGPDRRVARQMPEPIPALRQAARQLSALVPDGARFVTQRDFPGEITRTKIVNPDRWLAWASGRNTLNSFHVTSSQAPIPAYESEHILDRPPDAVAEALSRLGVTHLVTVSDEAAATVARSSRFSLVWRSSPIAIFSVSARTGQPDPSSLMATEASARARLLRFRPEDIGIAVEAQTATRATVAVGWSPKWHARLDGRPLKLSKAPDGQLQLTLPPGAHRLTLSFRLDVWDYLGIALSLATAGGTVWLLRRQAGEDDPSADPAPSTVVAAVSEH